MRTRGKFLTALAGLLIVVVVGGFLLTLLQVPTEVEYRDPEVPVDEVFADDPPPAAPPEFDPELVDSRRLAGREVNSSSAVIRLDVRPIRPGTEAHLEKIYPTYALAVDFGGKEVIPSVSLLESKCKQFDDALCAEVDLAAFRGVEGRLAGLKEVLTALRGKLSGAAAAYLDVALHLSGSPAVPLSRLRDTPAQRLLDAFLSDEASSRPIGFYNWDQELQRLYRAERFLAREFDAGDDLAVPEDLASALRADPKLLSHYSALVKLLRGLSNSSLCLSLDELPAGKLTPEALGSEARKRATLHAAVSFLPPSRGRETEFLERVLVRPGADVMRELLRRIRSGEVDLTPRKGAGWYEHQVWALEAMVFPGSGQEKGKLIFSARYKRRLLESFKAAVVRRRETHVRQVRPPVAPGVPEPLDEVAPRLRVEPAPTWYLRTARSYDFVRGLLESVLGSELEDMYGRRETWTYGQIRERKLAERDDDLRTELVFMRRLFYGLYLVSCEDIGLKPVFADGEQVNVKACRQAALNWIASFRRDPDLKPDARACVPAHVHADGSLTFWATVGVRLARMRAEYVRSPSLRISGGSWEVVPAKVLTGSECLIPVDAFASFGLDEGVLTRKEFWDLLGMAGTRDAFVELTTKARTRAALLKALEDYRRKEAEGADQ